MPSNEQLRTRLLKKLKELFQLDQPDLDFGFYRIMHVKAKQVQEFLDTDLLAIVETAFGQVDSQRCSEAKSVYEKAVETAKGYGAPEPENTPAVQEARAKYEEIKASASNEGAIYDHLYRFFERYYDDGDFISRRYYTRETPRKAAPFAVPYNGEEVKLHWANADQYYIKTAEYFNNFTFNLLQTPEYLALEPLVREAFGVAGETAKVHFKIAEAAEGEHGNVKESDANKRFFILHPEKPVELDERGELVVNFEYRSDPEKSGQDGSWREKRNTEAVEKILSMLTTLCETDKRLLPYMRLLKIIVPTEKDKTRPILAKYINQYTARNTMDYFIHKDLGGFLKRELDFYIKNEVVRLDDIENADTPAVESYLAKVKVLRKIATKLIDFLAQLENFQKKLWLKKKFVVETNYCVTLDRVPEELYAEIAANEQQREEWVRLFAIHEIKATDGDLLSPGKTGYCVPLTVEFLKENDKLVLDTQFFGEEFKERLLAEIEDFDEKCDGVLVHSENFQGLRLLGERYQGQVKCSYIDPPYNTGGDGFAYKDSYQHSSWITMIGERLQVINTMLGECGVLYSSIDSIERNHLESSLNSVFGNENRVEEIIWVQNTTKNQSPTFSTNHEYIEVYAKNILAVKSDFSMFREVKPGYIEIVELIEGLAPKYPLISDVEAALRKLYRDHKLEIFQEYADDANDEWKGIYNYNRAEYRDSAGQFVEEADAKVKKAKIWVWREDNPSMPQVKEDSQKSEFKDPNDPAFRFYKPIHPKTSKPCPHPKTGWRWPFLPLGKQSNCFSKLAADNRIAWGDDENKIPQTKRFLHEVETNVAKSVVNDYTDGEKELADVFGKSRSFGGPKPTTLIGRFCKQSTTISNTVLDFFAGSGTTAHAVINLNREDFGHRKYILIEMGAHFDTVLKPRIANVVYSPEWKDGKPASRTAGISHCFKYLRLESYEDTLNNLVFKVDPLRDHAITATPSLKEDYLLNYYLDVETRGSQSLLNIDSFADPTAYTLKVKKTGSDEYAVKHVDLIETFNYLIGLRVVRTEQSQSFNAAFRRPSDPVLPGDQNTKLVLDGKLKQDATGPWWFRKVEGWVPKDSTNPNNGQRDKVLVVWRKLTGTIEQDNLMLDEWFQKNRISTRDFEFDTIYVNGSNNLPNLQLEGDTWKVRLIEEEFMKRMWAMD
jgi:adenine-specific DNA-methyltransferase